MRTLEALRSQIVTLDPTVTATLLNWDIRVTVSGTIIDFTVRAGRLPPEEENVITSEGDLYVALPLEVTAFLGNCPKLDPDTALQYAAETMKLATLMIGVRRLIESELTYALAETRAEREAREKAEADKTLASSDLAAIHRVSAGMRVGEKRQVAVSVGAEHDRYYTIKVKGKCRAYVCSGGGNRDITMRRIA